MLKKIYEVIANDDLDFWCKFQTCKWWKIKTYICSDKHWRERIYNDEHNLVTKQSKEIDTDKLYFIWHPVMIWDVLDWREIKCNINAKMWFDEWIEIFWYWKEKRKSIDEQSDECIDFIYSLIEECQPKKQ